VLGAFAPDLVGIIAITRVFGAAPGTPDEQLGILRTAFDAMVADADFLSAITKAGFHPSPIGAEETTQIMTALSTWSPLRIGTFRWLWLATLVSNIGTWMHEVGAGWLMTTLATSPIIVSLLQTATM